VNGAESFASEVQRQLPQVKSGSLRIWGGWFGGGRDNFHRIVSCEVVGERVDIHFDEQETLSIWNPGAFEVSERTFRVRNADRVRWEWFYYGRPPLPENRYFEDFERSGDIINGSSNVDWYAPNLQRTAAEPAVEID
jgi:hypothetical protein